MKITKKGNLVLKNIFSAFLILLFLSPIFINHFNLTPVKADQELWTNQEGMTDVSRVFGGARAEQDPRVVIVRVISIALGFVGAIFLALTVFAGFKYMTAGGNQDQGNDWFEERQGDGFDGWLIDQPGQRAAIQALDDDHEQVVG